MSYLELEDIHKTYHLGEIALEVLKGVTLSLERGEMVALMGASGSGKTTLMNLLGCLDRPSQGRYLLDGEELSSLSSDQRARVRNQKIGFVFQNFNLLPRMSALENILLPLSYSPVPVNERQELAHARDLLARVGLTDRESHEPAQLSGGQQQRVAIARALINQPLLLLADEPTGNLDSQTSGEVMSLFRRLNEQEQLTIVIVTHDAEVASHTRRIIQLRDGAVVKASAPGGEH